jgi:hypothetical protein
LGLVRGHQLKRFERYLKEGRHSEECQKILFDGLQVAEGNSPNPSGSSWPPFLSGYLYWIIVLYEAVFKELPDTNTLKEDAFRSFVIFNLAAPLVASAETRFGGSNLGTILGQGKDALRLLGITTNWIPESPSSMDFPFSKTICALFNNKRYGQKIIKFREIHNEINNWKKGNSPVAHYKIESVLKIISSHLMRDMSERSDEELSHKIQHIKSIEQATLERGNDKDHLNPQIAGFMSEAYEIRAKRTPHGMYHGLLAYLRFLSAIQRLLIKTKKWLGRSEFKFFLNDLHYWSLIPNNIESLECDGTWMRQPRTIVTPDGSFTVSEHVYEETKKFPDWIARYGTLQNQNEIEEFAKLICSRLVGEKQQPT